MKKMKLWMMAAILFCGVGCLTSCGGQTKTEAETPAEDSVKVDVKETARLKAINSYLVDSIAKSYSQGEVSIPCAQIVDVDDTDPSAVLVWGDFWVFNYNVDGDTLKTVSGGNHPGLICLQSLGNTYVVTGFEQVADGSDNLPSAKRIFGDKFDAFQAINSDQEKREEARAHAIADYVEANNLPYKYYQDYGWPAQKIPVK